VCQTGLPNKTYPEQSPTEASNQIKDPFAYPAILLITSAVMILMPSIEL
jgi:hypothetical protein